MTLAHVKDGKLRALATTFHERSPLMPELPNFVEAGQPKFPIGPWFALVGPAGLSPDIVARMNKEMVTVLAKPNVVEAINRHGFIPRSSTPEAMAAYTKDQLGVWNTALKAAGDGAAIAAHRFPRGAWPLCPSNDSGGKSSVHACYGFNDLDRSRPRMKISVAVCTRNRALALPKALDSIEAALARVPEVRAEIVVVDNGSSDGTSQLLAARQRAHPDRFVPLFEPRKGLSCARNAALRHVRGDLVVFTDDDCLLAENYFEDALRHHAGDAEPVIRGGRVELADPTDVPLTIKTHPKVQRWRHHPISDDGVHIVDSIMGCNMTAPRSLFSRVGLFDERFGAGAVFPGSEESDFLCRALMLGFTIEYVPDMCVNHAHGRKVADARDLMWKYAVSNGALYAKFLPVLPAVAKPLVWNARKAILELFGGALAAPQWGTSHRTVLAANLRGMAGYWLARIRPMRGSA